MGVDANRVHHVVWCIRPENLAKVRAFWEETLGLPLEHLDLPELGLEVLISWSGGIEIMSPTYADGALAARARAFLDERGEGVYSVVFNVPSIDDAASRVSAAGGELLFRETIPPEAVDDRNLADQEMPAFWIHQALFDDINGMRICLQELSQVPPEPAATPNEGG